MIEDAGVTQKELREAGISELAIEVIELLTRDEHNPERSGDTYYRNIKAHPVARVVKIADIADNSNLSRIDKLMSIDPNLDKTKYPNALEVIGLSKDEQEWFDKDIQVVVH